MQPANKAYCVLYFFGMMTPNCLPADGGTRSLPLWFGRASALDYFFWE